MEPEEFCREIEAYLCRRNDGHLIRIVGPSFERVCEWAKRGIPLQIAFSGIDRYFLRYYAKGPRRRPVRIDFCEADVFDAFDEWRRAVGVHSSTISNAEPAAVDGDTAGAAKRRPSLPAHLERVIARLTTLRANHRTIADAELDRAVRLLDSVKATASGLRGEARAALLARLRALDAELLEAARCEVSPQELAAFRREAEAELGPFQSRMTEMAFAHAVESAVTRLVREHVGLPQIAFD